MSIKRRILAVGAAVSILFCIQGSNKRNTDIHRHGFVIKRGSVEYSGGTIIIGSQYKIDHIKETKEGDILVIDDRHSKDPDFKIVNSSKIKNFDIREEVIDALLCYEEKFPTKWERTKDSMMNEWIAHNVMSIFNYRPDRTNDVDFNNADEKTYKLTLK